MEAGSLGIIQIAKGDEDGKGHWGDEDHGWGGEGEFGAGVEARPESDSDVSQFAGKPAGGVSKQGCAKLKDEKEPWSVHEPVVMSGPDRCAIWTDKIE